MSERLDPNSFIGRLEAGRPASKRLLATFSQLFSQLAMQYAYQTLAESDPLQTATTGDCATDMWRAWRRARISLAGNRPLEAMERMRLVEELYPGGCPEESLPEAEWLWLLAGIAEEMNAIPKAITYLELAMDRLDQLVSQAEKNPGDLAEQLRTMLKVVANLEELDPGITQGDLIDGWLLGRGLELLGGIGAKQAQLFVAGRRLPEAHQSAQALEDIFSLYHEVTKLALDTENRAKVAMDLGEAWTEVDDQRSLEYFDLVVELLGIERAIKAAGNAANALFRLKKYSEAEFRYASLESLFEHFGMPKEAARMWVYEKMADWNRRHDPDIRHSLVGALKFYEENIPDSADKMTLFSLKKYHRARLSAPGDGSGDGAG